MGKPSLDANLIKKYHQDIVYNYAEYPTCDHWDYNFGSKDYKKSLQNFFELDKKTSQLDVIFHPRQKVTFKTRFKHLLGEVFEDILSSKAHKKVHIETVDDGDSYLSS